MNKKILLASLLLLSVLGLAGCSGESAKTEEKAHTSENTIEVSLEDVVEAYGLGGEDSQEEEATGEDAIETELTKEEQAQAIRDFLEFTLLDLEGNEISLSDYRGKYVIINFWATWCGFCVEEMPDLMDMDDENEDLVIIAVNVKEDSKTVEAFIKEHKLDMLIVYDSEGEVAGKYGISNFPTSIFIDKEGNYIDIIEGMLSKEHMENAMKYVRENY